MPSRPLQLYQGELKAKKLMIIWILVFIITMLYTVWFVFQSSSHKEQTNTVWEWCEADWGDLIIWLWVFHNWFWLSDCGGLMIWLSVYVYCFFHLPLLMTRRAKLPEWTQAERYLWSCDDLHVEGIVWLAGNLMIHAHLFSWPWQKQQDVTFVSEIF